MYCLPEVRFLDMIYISATVIAGFVFFHDIVGLLPLSSMLFAVALNIFVAISISFLREWISNVKDKNSVTVPKPFYEVNDEIKFKCTECEHDRFIEGPAAGAAQNIFCENCDKGWNYAITPAGTIFVEEI